jgi:SAM-dependent methyltransferase
MRALSYRETEVEKLRWFARQIPDSDATILDLGCGDAVNPFLPGRVIGVDLNVRPGSSNYARMVEWDLDNHPLPFASGEADVVILGDVIEHLRRPFELIEEAHRILRDDGLLLLSTPNPHYIHEVLKSWLNIPIADEKGHLVHFPFANLKQFLEQLGFRVERHTYFKFWIPKLKYFVLRTGVPSAFGYQYLLRARKTSRVVSVL